MSYLVQNDIANNKAMLDRVAAAAGEQGAVQPDLWTYDHRRMWSAAPGWSAAWESAQVSHADDGYDPGTDEAVITDGMILATVQGLLNAS